MKGHCKKCGWPWHAWHNKPTVCESCFEDPMTEFTPLVLFDQIGLNVGTKIMLAVRVKQGIDPDRLQEGIREWVTTETVEHCDSMFPHVVTHTVGLGMPGKARNDLKVARGGGRRIVVFPNDKSGSQIFEEDEFLEMFEPVRFKRFWREGEYDPELLRDECRIDKIVSVQLMTAPTGKKFTLDVKYSMCGEWDGLRDDHPLAGFKCYAELLSENLPLIWVRHRMTAANTWCGWLSDGWRKYAPKYLDHLPSKDVNQYDLQDADRAGLVTNKPSGRMGMMARALEGMDVLGYLEVNESTLAGKWATGVDTVEEITPNGNGRVYGRNCRCELKGSPSKVESVNQSWWPKEWPIGDKKALDLCCICGGITGQCEHTKTINENGRVYSKEVFDQLIVGGGIGWGKTQLTAQLLDNLIKHINHLTDDEQ